eukprot:4643010-Alexandrium_andersonii.AAC.1
MGARPTRCARSTRLPLRESMSGLPVAISRCASVSTCPAGGSGEGGVPVQRMLAFLMSTSWVSS